MKVYVIGCGRLNNDINLSYNNYNIATKEKPQVETVWYQGPSYCVLIEHPTTGYILYDIGSDPRSEELWPDCITETCYHTPVEGETLTEGLAKLGLEPKDIKHVIISHKKDIVQVVKSDMWTPSGMISTVDTTKPITISGNAYDDWYIIYR